MDLSQLAVDDVVTFCGGCIATITKCDHDANGFTIDFEFEGGGEMRYVRYDKQGSDYIGDMIIEAVQ